MSDSVLHVARWLDLRPDAAQPLHLLRLLPAGVPDVRAYR